MESKNILNINNGKWFTHDAIDKKPQSDTQIKIKNVEDAILLSELQTDNKTTIQQVVEKKGVNYSEFISILGELKKNGVIEQVGNTIIPVSTIHELKKKLINFLEINKEGITVAEFRDIIESNRKMALLLFEYFEKQKIVRRIDDKRVLCQK
jgi:selenocysteine-specific elongation factor